MKSFGQWVLLMFSMALFAYIGLASPIGDGYGWSVKTRMVYAASATCLGMLAFSLTTCERTTLKKFGQWSLFALAFAFLTFFGLAMPLGDAMDWNIWARVEYAIGAAGMGTIAFALIFGKNPQT